MTPPKNDPRDNDELLYRSSDPTPEQLEDPNYCGPGSPDWGRDGSTPIVSYSK